MISLRRGLCVGMLIAAAAGTGLAQGLPSVPGVSLPGVGGIGAGGSPGGTAGALGGTGGPAGGSIAGPIGGTVLDLANTVNNLSGSGGSGGQTQMIAGRLVNNATEAITVTRQDIEAEIESGLSRLEIGNWVQNVPPATLLDLRKLRLAELVRQSDGRLEMDGAGNPAVRGRLIAIDPTRAQLRAAAKAGFRVALTEHDPVLAIHSVTLLAPKGMRTAQAMQLLRRSSPRLVVEFDHVFEPAAGALAPSAAALAASSAVTMAGQPRIGMVDGGVGVSPALAHAAIVQKGFAGKAEATGHGTAVASLMVGSNGKFRGAAPSASLLVADVYGGNPAAGSAAVIVRAMSWIAAQRPSVINVSLVGPRNRLVERAVSALQARGIKVVAAVGNDGPAAPPLYPASQAGVIAVTGVDASNRALVEAGRPLHLDYAGPGADMAAALPGRGYAHVRGTSFAAPFISARLALTGSTARLDAEADRKGYGRIGRGIVCKTCRVPPKKVGAK